MTTNPYYLSRGMHETADKGRCAMEWVSYLAGEPHSDAPRCVSQVLTKFCIAFNDGLPDEERQRLRPYLARTIGTRDDGRDEERARLATDWLIRTYVPAWLTLLAGCDEHAQRLRSLPPVLTVENLRRAMVDVDEAGRQARAARAAAWAAARAAAWAAARAAAGAAAWDARNAAGAAAGAAARDALQPTVTELLRSTFDLLDRMLPTEAIALPVASDAELVCAGARSAGK